MTAGFAILTKCLENLKIVDYSAQEGKVFFGAWVEIENDDGVHLRFRVVGYDEIFGRKVTSPSTPDGSRAAEKEVGDLLPSFRLPRGETCWYVNEIVYVK